MYIIYYTFFTVDALISLWGLLNVKILILWYPSFLNTEYRVFGKPTVTVSSSQLILPFSLNFCWKRQSYWRGGSRGWGQKGGCRRMCAEGGGRGKGCVGGNKWEVEILFRLFALAACWWKWCLCFFFQITMVCSFLLMKCCDYFSFKNKWLFSSISL